MTALAAELRFLDRTKVAWRGRAYVFFGGTDYHRLSSHPQVIRALQAAAAAEGLSCAGSRATTGNHPLLARLERRAAEFLGAEEVVLCSSGYLSNAVALETVRDEYQRFFIDLGAHPSLVSPSESLPPDRVHAFRGLDPGDLARELRQRLRAGERPLVLTDGVLAADGRLPPLAAYWDQVRDLGGALLVDDSHGLGVVGPGGQGSPVAAGLPRHACLQTGTFSKAFGAFGGLVAGPEGLRARVAARSRAFVCATPIPPPVAAAALQALAILRRHPAMITGLQQRMAMVRERVRALGFPPEDSPAPILSISHADPRRNQRLRALLLQEEIYPTYIHYPGGPPGGHFRFTFSSAHTDAEVERLLRALAASCA